MDFLSGIVGSFGHMVGFLAQNADNISTVVGAVSRIAGVAIAEVVSNSALDEENHLPVLFNLLGTASNRLLKQMDTIMPMNGDANRMVTSSSGTMTTTFDHAALWKDPTLSPTGNVRRDLYSAVSNIMALNGIPTNINETLGGDLARLVSQQLFDKAPNLGALHSAAGDIVRTDFHLKALNEGITIMGTHLYYPIPLTQESRKQAWHSLIRMKYIQTPEAAEILATAKRARAIPKGTLDAPVPPYNRTTISVTWSGGTATDSIMSQAESAIRKQAGYTVMGPSHTALNYTYNVFTTVDIGPGAVLQSFVDATHGSLEGKLGTSSLSAPPAIPDIEIGQTSCTIA